MTTADWNNISAAEFVGRYGHVFEHSPWVVERAATARPFDDLHAGMMAVLEAATAEERLDLIRAHPELAGKAAVDGTLTSDSAAEQASAGLDRLTQEEYDRFHELNRAYRERFGFPFVICVKLTDKAGILEAMERRLGNGADEEVAAAIEEIGKIVRLRLEDLAR